MSIFKIIDIIYYISTYVDNMNDLLSLKHVSKSTFNINYCANFIYDKTSKNIIIKTLIVKKIIKMYNIEKINKIYILNNYYPYLIGFSNLEHLTIYNNEYDYINNHVYSSLNKLTTFNTNICIKDSNFPFLKNLKSFTYKNNKRTIYDHNIVNLTNLENLFIIRSKITDNGFSKLKNIKNIFIFENKSKLSFNIFNNLPKLSNIEIKFSNEVFDMNPIKYSPQIKKINMSQGLQYEDTFNLPNLESMLCVSNLNNIHNCNLQHLNNLIEFKDSMPLSINDNIIYSLTNLKSLILSHRQEYITNNAFHSLTNLTKLYCDQSPFITDDAFKYLKNLEELNCISTTITDTALSYLPNLLILNICSNNNITDTGLSYLKKLKFLSLKDNNKITYMGLSNLLELEELHLSYYNNSDLYKSITLLKKLKSLKFYFNKHFIPIDVLNSLPNLIYLYWERTDINGMDEKYIDYEQELFKLNKKIHMNLILFIKTSFDIETVIKYMHRL